MHSSTFVACLGAMVAAVSAQGAYGSTASPSASPTYGGSSTAPVSSSAPAGYTSSSASAPAGYTSSSASAPVSSGSPPTPYPSSTPSGPATYPSGAPVPTGGAYPPPSGNGTYPPGHGTLTTSSSTGLPSPTSVVPATGGAVRFGGSVLGLLLAGGLALVSLSTF